MPVGSVAGSGRIAMVWRPALRVSGSCVQYTVLFLWCHFDCGPGHCYSPLFCPFSESISVISLRECFLKYGSHTRTNGIDGELVRKANYWTTSQTSLTWVGGPRDLCVHAYVRVYMLFC